MKKKSKIVLIGILAVILILLLNIITPIKPRISPFGVTVNIFSVNKGAELFMEHFPGHVFWVTFNWNKVHITSMGKASVEESPASQNP